MGAGALAICQSKSAVRLKEDMKKIAAAPLNRPRGTSGHKVFGVGLQELQQQGLSKNGIPAIVCDVVEYLTWHGLKQEGLFRVNGNLKIVEQLRVKYESGEEVELATEGDISSAASLLKLFLRELPDRVITSAAHPKFIRLYQDIQNYGLNVNILRELLRQLPEAHYCLLKYLCRFLRTVAEHHSENKMNISNLATVFGPNCFRVSSGFEGMKEQEICNKIMAQMLENYSALFEQEHPKKENAKHPCEELTKIIVVKEACCKQTPSIILTSERELPKLSPRNKLFTTAWAKRNSTEENQLGEKLLLAAKPSKVAKSKQEGSSLACIVPQPRLSDGIPQVRIHLTDSLHLEEMDLADEISFMSSSTFFTSSQEDERPMSPFYLSAHVSQVNNNSIPATGEYLEKTIRSAVEQHLFDVHGSGGQSSEESESGTSSTSSNVSARQRRRHHKEQDEARRNRDMEVINKENIPSGFGSIEECMLTAHEVEKLQETSSGYIGERSKPKRQKSSTKLSELNDNQDSPLTMETFGSLRPVDKTGTDDMEVLPDDSKDSEGDGDLLRHSQNSSMKIQEHPSIPEAKSQRTQDADGQEESFVSEVPRLDLTTLCSDSNWEEPISAFSSWQRDGLDSDEARLSPQAGRLIRQLLDEDSDPMLSPRFYAYGQSQQYLDDTEVPPSPPNSHSFMRRRSSSLGSYEDDREDLTPAQLTRRIQGLKKKIRRFEEKFEEERKYRPSHSDKAANLEVLKWTNDLAKFRKQLKESKLKMSEEDLAPVVRQRSNTLPKSFGSQLEKEEEKKQDVSDKLTKPAVETTLDSIQKKLQEKRTEANRPEDIKDMTRDQIAAEKVALQKALLYYESIHGRPVTKHERQMMKPLYDRYRLVKQILSRANTIPIIGSPSSKRRSPLLQPIIEGETASFFKEIKEEEDGSEEESNMKPDFTVTIKSDYNVRSFLDQLEDDADGFVSPVDDRIPSRNTQDMGLSNLHAASMPELVEQLQEVREEKKRIRKKLRDFEDDFFRQNGRNVQKEDRAPMAEEYNEYKQVKAKLRLLEVLISKRDIGSKIM
ncbi:protein FAM13A isoform X2 [Rhineura floridana]|uniref:protein FAM13A isoform X2 n=1 Tax=Rhineura floridana TaxID=261503 RepID=UPI002AC89064|nr:protein FAM13A isoform X2 [Rhineura floridana]